MTEAVMTVEITDQYEITPTTWDWFCATSTCAITPKRLLACSRGAGISAGPARPSLRTTDLIAWQ